MENNQGMADEGMVEQEVVALVSVDGIYANPDQPRRSFDIAEIDLLAASISRVGLLQPIVVRPDGQGSYIIVAGERRYKAALRAGLNEVPVMIREEGAEQENGISFMRHSLLENLSRSKPNPLVETRMIMELLMRVSGSESIDDVSRMLIRAKNGRTLLAEQDVVARMKEELMMLGKHPLTFTIHNLKLLSFPSDVQQALESDKITPTVAGELARVKNSKLRKKYLTRAIAENLSKRQVTMLIKTGSLVSTGSARGAPTRRSAKDNRRMLASSCRRYKQRLLDDRGNFEAGAQDAYLERLREAVSLIQE